MLKKKINSRKALKIKMIDLFEECRDYDDSPCDSCCRRFHCPNNDPEEPEYCSWYLVGHNRLEDYDL